MMTRKEPKSFMLNLVPLLKVAFKRFIKDRETDTAVLPPFAVEEVRPRITAGQLREITGCTAKLAATYATLINKHAPRYGVNNTKRIAMFIAQVAHESARFEHTVENLNYSSGDLLATWPSRYTKSLAEAHHRNPELIANHVYGGRMGNNQPGDGYKYRGRGLIQLTGKNNYAAFERASGQPVLDIPEMLQIEEGAVESALWYWRENQLNRFADIGDNKGCTRLINGGYNGLADRTALYNRALRIMSWS